MKSKSLTGPFISLLALGTIFFGFEAWLRHQHKVFKQERASFVETYRPSENSDLIYRYRPAYNGVNTDGFRDREHARNKREGVFRIAVIGDSIAGGLGIPPDQAFPMKLERSLQKQVDTEVEVLLFAVDGYAISQEIILLEEHALDYDIDLVVWTYSLNDPANPIYHDASGELGKYFYEPKFRAWHELKKALFQVREKWMLSDEHSEYHQRLHWGYREYIEKQLKRIERIAKDNRFEVLFVGVPVFDPEALRDQLYDRITPEVYPWIDVYKDLESMATDRGFRYVDLLDDYGAYAMEELMHANYDPWHPGVLGHTVISHALTREILEAKYIR